MRIRRRGILVGLFLLVIISLIFFINEAIFKKEEVKSYKIVVITNGGEYNSFIRLENGIDRAKEEFNVDVEFINKGKRNNKEEQKEILEKKLNEDIDAIIISPVEYNYIKNQIENREKKIPIIVIESTIKEGKVTNIPYNNKKIGYKLGDEVISRGYFDKEIVIIQEENDYVKERIEGFAQSIKMTRNKMSFIKNERKEIEKVLGSNKEKIIVSFDIETLEKIVRLKENLFSYSKSEIYGVGTNNYLIGALERGSVNGISVQSEFNMGYLGIKTATKLIQGMDIENVIIDSKLINYENMHYENNQRILFPFNN
ncbi:MAG: substrate-binding domain-containing protein [Clostridium sp.]|uniref:substrate-binding domain-containing protein n=1 Tax=Clostridium sp. TaxID=1506 RepID=UPI003EE66D92